MHVFVHVLVCMCMCMFMCVCMYTCVCECIICLCPPTGGCNIMECMMRQDIQFPFPTFSMYRVPFYAIRMVKCSCVCNCL